MNWNEFLQNVLYAVIIAVVPLITRLTIVYINTKIQQRTSEIENENLRKYINAATEAVSLAVLSVQQTYTDSLKAAGKFDKEAQKTAKKLAIEKGREEELKLYELVEKLAPQIISGERTMYKGVSANVDF